MRKEMPCSNEKQFLYQLIISQLYYDGYKPHASLLEEAVLDTHQAVLPSDNLRSLLTACSNTIRTADVIFTNWNKAKKCSETPELSSQPLGQSLLQLYSNSLQPSPNNGPTFEQVKQQQQKQHKRQQQNIQRQIHQQQQQQIKQMQQQQQSLLQQQQQVNSQQPIISLSPYHNFASTADTQNTSRSHQTTASTSSNSPQISKAKSGSTIPSSPITPSESPAITSTNLPLTTFSEYTNELNDVLQVSSEVLNITSSPKDHSKDITNPSSPIDVTAFLNIESSSKTATPPTINTSPISNPESKAPEPLEHNISETQDLLDKLQSLSSGDLSDTSILQKLSPNQINLLTCHLETSQGSTTQLETSQGSSVAAQPSGAGRSMSLSQAIHTSHELPIQGLEELEDNRMSSNDGIITLGGVKEEQLSMELEEILANVERSSDQDIANMSGNDPDRLRKPTISYPAMIAMAILNSESKRLLLGDIYRFIMDKYPYYRLEGQGWRNSIRHNLSLNDCFMKAGRAESGKGHYWTVRPDSIKEFQNGGYRRRLRRTCTRGGSISMSPLLRDQEARTAAGVRPQISLAPFLNTLKQERCSPSPVSSPPSSIKETEAEQQT